MWVLVLYMMWGTSVTVEMKIADNLTWVECVHRAAQELKRLPDGAALSCERSV